jgi:DNA-binding NarL/FixJ family response regulator
MKTRILIADDHGVMRAALRSILEKDPALEVAGEAVDGNDVIHAVRSLHPDIVLMDIGMPGVNGIEAARSIKASAPKTRILILSVYEDERLLREAFKAGADGYIIKRAAGDELLEAVHAVLRGDIYVHPGVTHFLLKDFAPSASADQELISELTPRELDVMGFIVKGCTNRQIGENLSVSVRTVETHRASLLAKLGLKNRVELIEYAARCGLFRR